MSRSDRISTLALAAVVSALVAVVSAPGASAPARRLAGTPVSQAQFTALRARVGKDEKVLTAAAVLLTHCLTVQALPVSQYEGYAVTFTDGTTGSTSALDLTDQGDAPGAYLVGTPSDCAAAFTSGQKRTLAGVSALRRLTQVRAGLSSAARGG